MKKRLDTAKLPVEILFGDIPGERKEEPKDFEPKSLPTPTPPPPPKDDIVEACKFFGLEIGCTKEDVNRAYRKQSAPLHPDKQDKTKSEGALKFIQDKFIECGEKKDLLMKYFELQLQKETVDELSRR